MLGFWNWGFRATVKLHSAPRDKSARVSDSLTFYDVLHQQKLIDTTKKLWLHPALFNGSLQTMYYAMHNSKTEFAVYYGREIFAYADGGVCSLDWVIPPEPENFKQLYEQTLPANSPRLHPRTRFLTEEEHAAKQSDPTTDPLCVVFHGLAGGSHEPLIRNLGQYLKRSTDHNWDVVVVNSRGCCRTKITSGKLFNALSTDDLREVLEELHKRYPNRKIYTVGFSFGAVLLANYLGEAGEQAKELVTAAAMIGCPWDMSESARHLDSSWTGRYLFNPNLTAFLNKLVRSNRAELKAHEPELFSDERMRSALQAKKTYQWDNIFTCKTAGYELLWAYYDAGLPYKRIYNIAVPALMVNSTDDPAVAANLPRDEVRANGNVALVETDLGGHLGWVKPSGEFWCVEVADDFINGFHGAISGARKNPAPHMQPAT